MILPLTSNVKTNIMSTKKIITVFGATGAQGGGLVRAIINDPQTEFAVRAVTRDTTSEKAKALAALGAEVVAADIDDPAAVEKALEGAYGAFFVTFFWAHFSPEKEKEEVRIYAEAAQKAGVQHIIWSTLEDTRKWIPLTDNRMPTLGGQYKVPHFDAKGESDQEFTKRQLPVTFLLTSFYWENFIYFGMGPKRNEEGKLVLTLPMGEKPMASIAAEDIGKCAYGIFRMGPQATTGKYIGIAGSKPTGAQMAASLTKVLGEEVLYQPLSHDTYRSLGFPGADDLGNMFQFYHDFDFDFNGARDEAFARQLNPELQSLDVWLQENGRKIPVDA